MGVMTYYINVKTALAGALCHKLEKDPQADFLSAEEFNIYSNAIAHAIRCGGDHCVLLIDRYRLAAELPYLADIVENANGGFKLVGGIDKDALVNRLFGSIPITIIKYMQVADEIVEAR